MQAQAVLSGLSAEPPCHSLAINPLFTDVPGRERDRGRHPGRRDRTPLAAIEGYTSLLSSSPPADNQQEYACRILENCRQLTSLTGNILLLSKLNNQKIIPDSGFIHIRLCASMDSVLVSFADSGIGMTQDEQPRIFDLSFRNCVSIEKKIGEKEISSCGKKRK